MVSRTTTGTSPLLRQMSASAVLEALRGAATLDASDLMLATGLSRPTIHTVCDDLIAAGLVLEQHHRPARGTARPGRRARTYAFNAAAALVLGVDLGAHTVRVLLSDLGGHDLGRIRQPYRHEHVPATERLATARAAIASVLDSAGADAAHVRALGLGVPGPVDARGRVTAVEEFLPGLAQADLRATLAEDTGWDVLVDNDANLAVLAERWRGVAAGLDDVVLLLAGERLGTGLFLGGNLVRGNRGGAGEMAFLSLVDGVGGTTAVGALARELGAQALTCTVGPSPGATPGHPQGLAELVGGDPGRVSGEAVFAAARAGDPVALEVVEDIAGRMARVVSVLATLLDPELVVVGGAVAAAGDLLTGPLRRALPTSTLPAPRIEVSRLGDEAVVVGAVRLALDHVHARLLERPARLMPSVEQGINPSRTSVGRLSDRRPADP